MFSNKLSLVFRAVDTENRLLERADQKSISLLSILGVFMVFFIVYYRVIPINVITVPLIVSYFGLAITAIVNLIMTMRPRVRRGLKGTNQVDKLHCEDPLFFAGICEFKDFPAFAKSLENLVDDEAATFGVYLRQLFSLAQINTAKYLHLQRATILVIIALTIELSIIMYLFVHYMGIGAVPPIF
jgi:hypothetical protein